MNTKHLLLTFDYELFLGAKSGTVDNCLIKPTNKLLAVLNKYNVKHSIFFVDTIYLLKLRSNGNANCQNDYTKLIKQLVNILKQGHYIFPHLHTHWLDAVYSDSTNQWDLTNTNQYRFHQANDDDKLYYFTSSIDLILDIQKQAATNYPINSYRAGGFCLQPFVGFKPFFETNNITNDFSVLSGFKGDGTIANYNYTSAPKTPIYNFNNDVLKEEKQGAFTAFCISSINTKKWFYTKLIDKYNYLNNKNKTDGKSILVNAKTKQSLTKKYLKVESCNQMVSIELLATYNLKKHKNYFKHNSFMQFVSHPKMILQHHLNVFDKFLKHTTLNYKIETNYTIIKNNLVPVNRVSNKQSYSHVDVL